MKTVRRHELQTNVLADQLGHLIEAIKPYTQLILGCVLAAVVVFAGYSYWSAQARTDEAAGWDNYLHATASSPPNTEELTKITEQHKGTAASLWSNLALGDYYLNEGTDIIFSNRVDGAVQLNKAEQHYKAAQAQARASNAGEGLLEQRATLGMARVYESLPNLKDARNEYNALVTKWPDGVYVELAKQRLVDLDKLGTKEFYDWVAEYKPKSPVANEPGVPGLKPEFDINKVPEPEFPGSGTTLTPPDDKPAIGEPADKVNANPAVEKPAADQPAAATSNQPPVEKSPTPPSEPKEPVSSGSANP